MGETAGVQSDHALLDVVAAEEVAAVVEQHFVVIVVVVEERHLERAGVGFHRSRGEGADHETVGDEGGVYRRRQVVAMADQRANIAPVKAYHGVVTVPADHVQRVVGVGHGADLAAPLDADLPGVLVLLRLEGVVDMRVLQHRQVEDRLRAEQALVRQLIGAVGVLDQQEVARCAGLDAPGGATGDQQVVAVAVLQMAEVAVEMPTAFMDEQQLVTIGVAHQMAHGAVGAPDAQLDVGVVQRQRRRQRAVALAGNVVEVERMRTQRALPVDPAGGRMLMVQVRGGAEEALTAHLALVCALRQVAMRLTRALAFTQGKANPLAAHGITPRRSHRDATGLPRWTRTRP